MLSIDPVAINLAGGSYLKLGLALQFTEEYDAAKHEGNPDGSKALDIAISQFSGAALSRRADQPRGDEGSPAEGDRQGVRPRRHSIYYTEYVTQ